MKIALIQQHATINKVNNVNRGVESFKKAAKSGAQLICFAELAFEPFYPQKRASGDVTNLAETIPGPITDTFTALAKKYGIVDKVLFALVIIIRVIMKLGVVSPLRASGFPIKLVDEFLQLAHINQDQFPVETGGF